MNRKPAYSVVIPAYNEEAYLPHTIRALRDGMDALLPCIGEIVLVDNGSTDETASLSASMGCRVVTEPFRQIARARNTGARHALGKWIFFVDADTIVPKTTMLRAYELLASGEVGCGGAYLIFDDDRSRWISGRMLPWLWNRISSRMKLFAGSFVFCEAELFHQCGGFPETHFAGEEILLAGKVKRACRDLGKKIEIITEFPVVSSARKLDWYDDWSMLTKLSRLIVVPSFLQKRQACGFWYDRPTKD